MTYCTNIKPFIPKYDPRDVIAKVNCRKSMDVCRICHGGGGLSLGELRAAKRGGATILLGGGGFGGISSPDNFF